MRKPDPRRPDIPLDWRKVVENATGKGAYSGTRAAERLTETTEFGANPGALRMLSHVPDELAAGAPLVVSLHGCGQSAAAYAHGAGWVDLAGRLGFALLAPEQRQTNNPNGCFSWFQPGDTRRGGGEAASIHSMIQSMIREHGLDARRVYVTGLSAGGAMTSVMLAAYPEVFAAGAIVAGLPYGAAADVQQGLACMRAPPKLGGRAWGDKVRDASGHDGPWPRVSVWHGDADWTVSLANAEAITAQWSDLHGVRLSEAAREDVGGHTRLVWRNGAGEPVIESVTLTGLAHGTPIASATGPEACGAPGPFILEAGISSSYRIADFWGLTQAARATAVHTAPALPTVQAGPPRPEAVVLDFQPVPPEPPKGRLDPGAVINKALRAAGLMPGG